MKAVTLATLAAVAACYEVKFEDVTVGNYSCHSNKSKYEGARVYYPDAPGRFPVISWAHGYNNPGNQSYLCYAGTLEAVAAGGYVVIAAEASSFPFFCTKQWRDQYRSLEWAQSSDFAERIDFAQAGLLGHSMGGFSTFHSAAQADMVRNHSVRAAVVLNAPGDGQSQPVVPIFFGSGSNDTYVNPASVQAAYENVTGVPKAFAEIDGAIHQEPQSDCGHNKSFGPQRHSPYIVAFFDCHLKGNTSQCGKVYGDEIDSMCNGDVNMTVCEHANEPAAATLAV